jgi:hypothetical protein
MSDPVNVLYDNETENNLALLCLKKKQLISMMRALARRWPSSAVDSEIDMQKKLLLNIVRKSA